MVTPLPKFDEPVPEQQSKGGIQAIPGQLVSDLKVLLPQFLLPCSELISIRWVRDLKWIGIFLLALFPLVVFAAFSSQAEISLGCFALYFSVLWLFCFHMVFNSGEGNWKVGGICFAVTAVIALAVMAPVLRMGLEQWRDAFIFSPDYFVKILGELFTVAIPEYVCRIAVILFFLRPGATVSPLPAMVFYGLASGLAMGMADALTWQIGNNDANQAAAYFYLHSLLQLTTFPFMQAIWTGLAAYFLTLGRLYPSRRWGLWTVAVCLPIALETIHSALPVELYWADIIVNFAAIFMLLSYLSRRSEFERALQENS